MYNFDKLPDRRKTNCIKWDVKSNELPLWVADMDFEAPNEIKDVIVKRAEHGVFGYADVNQEWRNSYIYWWQHRYNFNIQSDWIIFSTGVVASISSIVRKITTPNENIVLLTPTYNIFYNCIINNGRHPLESQLLYKNGEYSIDFDDLELKLRDEQTSLMILCNPQNPVGKIWDKETLSKIGKLCKDNNVVVLSDEIHCDITSPGYLYTPFASVNAECADNCIMTVAPTKTFNLAGLNSSAVIVPNKSLCHKVWRGINTDECGEPNAFAVDATVAAYTKGEAWLEELRQYIKVNRGYIENFILQNIPSLTVVKAHATYLAWIDISKTHLDGVSFASLLREKTGLYISNGNQYGSGGENFIRVNLATSLNNIKDGMNRLKSFIDILQI